MGRYKYEGRGEIPHYISKLFVKNTKFRTAEGRIKGKYAPFAFNKNWKDTRRIALPKQSGVSKFKIASGKWEYRTVKSYQASYGQGKTGKVMMRSLEDVAMQLQVAVHELEVSLDNWKTVIVERAYKSTMNNFRFHRFDNNPWADLSDSTKRNRQKLGYWPGHGILRMTEAMMNSIAVDEEKFRFYTQEVTDYYGRTRNYSGVHNNPKDVFSPLPQRQFIGHSADVDMFIKTYQGRYLFDSVFRNVAK